MAGMGSPSMGKRQKRTHIICRLLYLMGAVSIKGAGAGATTSGTVCALHAVSENPQS